jgi:hypothetical protein
MKRLLLTIAACLPMLAQAQILNPGFEEAGLVGRPAYWSSRTEIPFTCNNPQGFDSTMFQSLDAHSGNYALEIRNTTCDTSALFGFAVLMPDDTSFHGAPFTDRPSSFSLYCKFLADGGDVGIIGVSLEAYNSDSVIGVAEVAINQEIPDYTLITLPFTYFSNATPDLIRIYFQINNFDTIVHAGSRFLVDDVSTLATGIDNTSVKNDLATLFPNPSVGTVTIKSIQTEPVQLTIYNSLGQQVLSNRVAVNTAISLDKLTVGIYLYTLRTNTKLLGSGKLVKE